MMYSVVICSLNGHRVLLECLAALAHQEIEPDLFEVLVVDDGSAPELGPLVEPYIPRFRSLRVVRHPVNLGLSAARNTGWREAKGEIVLYIDDDAVPPRDWVSRIGALYREGVAGAGGICDVPGETLAARFQRGMSLERGGPGGAHSMGAGGNNMSFRRAVLDEIGGFDPAFRRVGDDADINRRLREAGKHLVMDPTVCVLHHLPTKVMGFLGHSFRRGEGVVLWRAKWGPHRRLAAARDLASLLLGLPGSIPEGVRIARLGGMKRVAGVALNLAYRISLGAGIIWFGLCGRALPPDPSGRG